MCTVHQFSIELSIREAEEAKSKSKYDNSYNRNDVDDYYDEEDSKNYEELMDKYLN